MKPDAPLVMLHGWALHGGVFASLAGALAGGPPVTCPDLPGHGGRPYAPAFRDLDGLADAVERDLPARCTLLGWSLGGMIAARLAARGCTAIERLALVDTTPRFVAGAGWRHGLTPADVEQFAAALRQDYRRLVSRFLALQVRGDARQAKLLRQLRSEVFARGEPDPDALAAGLEVLCRADLRQDAGRIAVPTLVVCGHNDRLTPPAAARWLAGHIPGSSLEQVAGAGHAPFLSRPAAVADVIRRFLDGAAPRRASA